MSKLIILDTNVLMSAALFKKSEIRQLFNKVRSEHTIVVSEACFDEFKEVIYRPKFRKYIEPEDVELFLRLFKESALFVPITEKLTLCRDPKDDKFLELALASDAHYLITGDQDLLVLNPFNNTQINSPTEFLTF